MKTEDKRKEVFELMDRSNICKFTFGKSQCMFYTGIKSEKTTIDDQEVYNVWNTSTDLYKQLDEKYLDMILSRGVSYTSDKLRYERYSKKINNIQSRLDSNYYSSYAKKIAISTIENLRALVSIITENRKKEPDFFDIN